MSDTVASAAYARGTTPFMGLELLAAPGALVPRAETEVLGRAALAALRAMPGRELTVVDMCCGSGNLACAIARLEPRARVWACDLTDGCVALAARNRDHLGLAARVTVSQGDLFAPLADLGLAGRVDLVVCNPPYISTGRLAGDRGYLLELEPREAFDGGPYGLAIHQRVVRDALAYLRPGGSLGFELGVGQSRQLELLLQRARGYGPPVFTRDADGEARAVFATTKVTQT